MLIEIRITNCFSIQNEQVLSLIANNDNNLKTNTFQVGNLTLLKSVAIYGANAAGKSNIVKIIQMVKMLIFISARTQRGETLPLMPFLLGNDKNKPSEVELSFIMQDIKYRYGFAVTQEKVLEEWLFAYPNGRAQQWFLRAYDERSEKYHYEFGSRFLGKKKLWENLTRDNALFLSTAIQLNSEQLKPVFDWFHRINICDIDGFRNALDITMDTFDKNKNEILKYLKAVDLDIEDVSIESEELDIQKLPEGFPNDLKEMILHSQQKLKKTNIAISHLNQQGQQVEFNIDLESDGTKKFFDFLGIMIHTLEQGNVLVVDELHNHLHPLITKFIIGLFHNETINKNNAQLIFTTHETSILDDELFRKDQIYFCEKRNKATILYSMSDFKHLRDNIDFEKSYLLGRFGALPNLKQF